MVEFTEQNPLDPMLSEDLSGPMAWFERHRVVGPKLGALLFTNPEKAIEALAAVGVPPPPMADAKRRGMNPGRVAAQGLDPLGPLPDVEASERAVAVAPGTDYGPGSMQTGENPMDWRSASPDKKVVKTETFRKPKEEGRVPQEEPKEEPTYVPPGAQLDPDPQWPFPGGANDLRQTGPGGGRALDIRPEAQGPPKSEGSDLAKIFQGLKAIAPPALPNVGTPHPPMPRVDGPPRIDTPNVPQGRGEFSTINPIQLLQFIQQMGGAGTGSGPMLSNLMRR